jgi:hypothetical protein
MKTTICLCLTAIILSGCSGVSFSAPTPTPTCAQQAAHFLDEIFAIQDEWKDAETLAGSTPRMSLPPIVSNFQEIRRRADAITAPECAEQAKSYAVDYMDRTIEAYLLFLSQESDTDITNKFDEANRAYDNYFDEVAKIRSGEGTVASP